MLASVTSSSLCALALDAEWVASPLVQVAISSQQTLGDEALFSRCYTHLTRRQAPRNHPLRTQVRLGQKKPIDACLALLGQASFASADRKGLLAVDNDESRAVLETFNTFHQSWFPSVDTNVSVAEGQCWARENAKVYDFGEPALYPTRSLFNAAVPYKEVVTAATSLSAVRSANASSARIGATMRIEDELDKPTLPIVLPQTGKLLGVVPLAESDRKDPVMMGIDEGNGWNQEFNGRSHHGAGVLGSQPYLVLNSGRVRNERMDGGILQHRRWSAAVYHDLLCRDLPVLRLQDVKLYVQPEAPNRPPFRQGQSCMQCHTSIDPMAGTIRHLALGPWGKSRGECEQAFLAARPAGDASKPREVGLVDADPDFYKRPTYGRLHFRSYDGTLILKEVKNLAELGTALAETNDLYVCAASRYFQFFTGIAVNLQDAGDPSMPALNTAEIQYRNQVISLGLQLKKHQRLDKLIEEIMRSPVYQKASMRRLAGESP